MASKFKSENDMIKAIHEKRLFDELMPAIRSAVRAGGGADVILKKSESLASVKLIEAMGSEKEEVRLKAATEILNRTQGRPVERSVSVFADISRMDERSIDSQIMQLLERTGAKQLVQQTLQIPTAKKKAKQKRKPRTSDPMVIDAQVVEKDATDGLKKSDT